MRTTLAWLCGAIIALAAPAAALADEGMWTFDNVPVNRVEQSLGVRLDGEWLDHLRRASVRLTTGCSGAVVSRHGLVLTNQHCAIACAQSLSNASSDFVRDGFGVDDGGRERQCPGMQAEILVGIDDITSEIFAASAGKVAQDYVAAREGVMARAQHRLCRSDPLLRCQVIAFFGGGQFKVYVYRIYSDVRLAFAPEFAAAFFGGDPDNFNFPRFDLDFAFLRLYESDRPAATADWLAWSSAAPRAGEPVFVSGNPSATERAFTVSQMETQRDVVAPYGVATRVSLRDALIAWSQRDAEAARLAAGPLFVQENDLKLIRGRSAALNDAAFMERRRAEEADLKIRLLGLDPKLAAQVGDPWADLATIQTLYARQYAVWRELESAAGAGSILFDYARLLVRGAAERPRPSAERLPEFADPHLALTQKTVLDERAISPSLERVYLQVWLEGVRRALGPDAPATSAIFGGQPPSVLARRLAEGTHLADPAVRRALWSGGRAAILASDDPLIAFVRDTDPLSRAAREIWEQEVVGPTDRALERIARARLALRDQGLYPDATFSPRLSYGRVAGWTQGGAPVGAFTTFAGLFSRTTGTAPFALPPRWLEARDRLDGALVLNFATTNDIAAGNSGSPVVNARGQIVGAAFDGNQASIAGDFAYDGRANRTVAVSTVAIAETLAKVYGRVELVRELEAR